ncbi:MAG: STAS domain-containing protein [bacterium]|nr:STAS domain-containing protein [bacterium]
MKLTTQSDAEPVTKVSVGGKVSQRQFSGSSDPLADMLGGDIYQKLVAINMEHVEVLDSSGVGWLLNCNNKFKDAGGAMALHSLSLVAKNVFRVLNMHLVFTICANEAEAVKKLIDGQNKAEEE